MDNSGGGQQGYGGVGGGPHPPSSIMAAPHSPAAAGLPSPSPHSGYYAHNPYQQQLQQQQHYPATPTTTTQQPYYTPYYGHHTPNPQQQQQHYQSQQWTTHHGQQQGPSTYYAQQQTITQTTSYPPPSHSPYPSYPTQPQQQQQHSPIPSILPQPIPQQQQQQQPQHALMNLSQFVNRQSPSPIAPIQHQPHSPTTPIPPSLLQQQPYLQGGPLSPNSSPPCNPLQQQVQQQQSLHHHLQQQQQMQHNLQQHQMQQQQQQGGMMGGGVTGVQQGGGPVAGAKGGIVNVQMGMSLGVGRVGEVSSGGGVGQVGSVGCGGGSSGSSSPTNSTSTSGGNGGGGGGGLASPPLSIHPPPSPASSQASSTSAPANGSAQMMIPVRLQNMQSGARTKASMRKMMQDAQQQGQGGQGGGGGAVSNPTTPTPTQSKVSGGGSASPVKKSVKSPKKAKKSPPTFPDLPEQKTEGSATEQIPPSSNETPTKETKESSKESPLKDTEGPVEEIKAGILDQSSNVRPGYTKHGKKIGRPPKPKLETKDEEEGGKVGKKGKAKSKTPHKDSKEPKPTDISDPPLTSDLDEPHEKEPATKSSPTAKKGKKQNVSKTVSKSPKKAAETEEEDDDVEEEVESSFEREDSESEYGSSEGLTSPRTRPQRSRAAKGGGATADKNKKSSKSGDRSRRTSRPSRATRVGSSASKSPSTSPPKASSAKASKVSTGRRSSKKSPVHPPKSGSKKSKKKSPRLNKSPSVSPSPLRLRQKNKEEPGQSSPASSLRRETRSSISKDRDDDVTLSTRSTRVRPPVKYSTSPSGPSDGNSTSPSPKRRSPKGPAEPGTTSIRILTSRLAKEKSAAALKASKETTSPTPKPSKSPVVKKGSRGESSKETVEPAVPVVKGKKSRTLKRKRSEVEEEELKSEEEVEKREEVVPLKSKTPPAPKSRRTKVQMKESQEDLSESDGVRSPIPKETVESGSSPDKKTDDSTSSESGSPNKSQKINEGRRVSISDGRRGSKSPRIGPTGNLGSDFTMNTATSDLLQNQNTNPVVVIPPLPQFNNSSSKERRASFDLKAQNNQTPVAQGPMPLLTLSPSASEIKAVKSAPKLVKSPIDKELISSVPSTGYNTLPADTKAEPITLVSEPSTLIHPSAKAKKVRKPKVLNPTTTASNLDVSGSESVSSVQSGDGLRKQSKLEKQMEFQQRKANLEVEVAQVLLEMKNSSKSPSPVKMDSSILSTPSPLVGSPAKPRKRKSTSSDVSSNPVPVAAPVTSLGESAQKVMGKKSSSKLLETITIESSPESKVKKSKKKKASLSVSLDSNISSINPTILAVPHVPGVNGKLGIHPPMAETGASVSFQNSPKKAVGPVKVAKTAVIPQYSIGGGDVVNSIASTAASVLAKSGNLFPTSALDKSGSGAEKKKKKKVVPKALTPTIVTEAGGRTKRKYTRKSDVAEAKGSMDNQGSGVEVKFKNLISSPNSKAQDIGNVEPTVLADLVKDGKSSSSPDSKKFSKSIEKSSVASEVGAGGPAPKKARKSSVPKVQKPEPFQLHPKSIPLPTVFVKSPLLVPPSSNGAGATSERKERTRIGPSLKVIGGKTKFYRGTEQEELDAEPPISNKLRGTMQFDPEVPWLCCFCNLGPHAQKLGDLFGPYYTEVTKGKTSGKRETWMHQDCALWAGNVVLIGTKLHGLEETLGHSNCDSCTTCGKKGATIGCLKRGCKQAVHFPCAIRKSWKLEEETFHSYCPAHIA